MRAKEIIKEFFPEASREEVFEMLMGFGYFENDISDHKLKWLVAERRIGNEGNKSQSDKKSSEGND